MWQLVSFFFLVELSSLCSSLCLCMIFLILKKLHHNETPWKKFLYIYGKRQRMLWVILVEILSLSIITPISFWWCYSQQMEPVHIWASAVPLLSLISTLVKYAQVIQVIKKANREEQDDAIYQAEHT